MGSPLMSGGYAPRADQTRGTFTKPTKTVHLERAAGDQNPRKPEQGLRGAGSSVEARDRRHDLLFFGFAVAPLSYGHQREGERSCGCLTECRPFVDTNM